jgi:hypothetical protein
MVEDAERYPGGRTKEWPEGVQQHQSDQSGYLGHLSCESYQVEYSDMSDRESRNPMSTARVSHDHAPARKMSKHEAARKLAQLAEQSMTRNGLSEEKKNARVQSFIEYVDAVNENRAK